MLFSQVEVLLLHTDGVISHSSMSENNSVDHYKELVKKEQDILPCLVELFLLQTNNKYFYNEMFPL